VPVHAVVLAAGKGGRFGSSKLHASLRGRPLLGHVLDVVLSARQRGLLSRGFVVLAQGDEASRELAHAAGLSSLVNSAPELGLGHSLQLALNQLQSLPDPPAGALVFLGDQPLVRLDVVDAVISAWQEKLPALVRPRYQASPLTPGHPVLLDRSIWHLAARLQGDAGFAAILDSTDLNALTIDVTGDNPDVDTRADLIALEESSR
jgi:molybdenum cofactor cytidylyltransferase